MSLIVMKFGGASVQSISHIENVAKIIENRLSKFSEVLVVVSAMANMTDDLLSLATAVHPNPPKREVDMLISVGERVSMSLLAMALAKKNIEAISFTGSQSGIITNHWHTDARIVDVRPIRPRKHLAEKKVVIVAGFQGVSREGEITTLGRGGGDTTAVALAIALNATKIEFYKDVEGIYNADPKKEAKAVLYPTLSYKEALEIALGGAKILHSRAVQLAAKNFLPLLVKTFKKESQGTLIYEAPSVILERPFYEDEQ